MRSSLAKRFAKDTVLVVDGTLVPTRDHLRDCRLKGDGVHHAMAGIARMHNLTLAGELPDRPARPARLTCPVRFVRRIRSV
ncbi:hypothetical protein [Actinacidiphila rubida]|uniref:hypothetical protein n=1 Tax=Actinacidiphila rubida TaxID=310780 RepID=UPI0038994F5D